MKNTAISNEEVLILLASKGDVAAFYSLAAPYFEIEYLNLRHNGSTHNDAVEKILPDSSVLFRKIIGNCPTNFSEWFKNNSEISINESDEVALFTPDKNLVAQQNHFLKEIQLHLLRTASEFNKKKRKKVLEFLRNPRTKLALIITIVLIVLSISLLILHATDSSMHIGFRHAEKEFNFVVGSIKKAAVSDSSLNFMVKKPDSTQIDSIVKDTTLTAVIKEEKRPEPPPVKKVYHPKPVVSELPRASQAPQVQTSPSPESSGSSVEETSPAASSGSSIYSTPAENSAEQ
ncbi:MAG TPA: hypothetical protein VHP36_04435 [Chitinispirillaceae bacterium]|nr:hypothetical protein [Chitinispirillaceae bacterium]